MNYFMGIDLGTSSTKTLIMEENGKTATFPFLNRLFNNNSNEETPAKPAEGDLLVCSVRARSSE